MGCKCLSVSAPISVKEGLDPAACCMRSWASLAAALLPQPWVPGEMDKGRQTQIQTDTINPQMDVA